MINPDSTILVTGGAGFIGSAVVRHLISNTNHKVINLDKLTYAGNLNSIPAAISQSERYVFEQVDICDRAELDRVFQQHQPGLVMHLAAESHVDRSIDGPAEFMHTNIIGTYTLLEAARAYWNQLPASEKQTFRFHHVSTDEVYGDLQHPDDLDSATALHSAQNDGGVDSATSFHSAQNDINETSSCAQSQDLQNLPLFTESTAYAPSSPYSASKASSDHLVRAWQRTYGLPILVTNCSNNYGPYHFPEKLIPHVILNALAGKPLPIYGKGDQIRDWLYVEDHARALVKVITEGKVGETYNIGGHNEKRNIEVVQEICRILDELRPLETMLSSSTNHPSSCAQSQEPQGAMQDSATALRSAQNDGIELSSCAQSQDLQQDLQRNPSYADLITHVTDRPGHDRRYAIDSSKMQQELGWTPQETFETGLRKTVQWYLDNEQWWQNVLSGDYQLTRIGDQA